MGTRVAVTKVRATVAASFAATLYLAAGANPATAATPAAATASTPALPSVRPAGDIAGAFGAASRQNLPQDLSRAGYVEAEYVVSGRARLYDWPAPGEAAPRVLGDGPYVTRILVRRPRDPRRFSGTAVVEPFNPSAAVDLPIMWAQSSAQFIADGHAWVGITVKPVALLALRRFDPVRYGALAMANPEPAPRCAAASINPLSGPATPAEESGLAWDIISQVGALLKDPAAAAVLGAPATRLYLTGQSQSAGYARTWASVFARGTSAAVGGPLYDGYLYSGSPPWQVPLHQCRPDLATGDPRLLTPPVGVPVIELFAEGDVGTNLSTRRLDADVAPDLFRRYEVAGAPHVDSFETRALPRAADVLRAGGRAVTGDDPACAPAGVEASDFRNRHAFNAAWRNLDAWVRDGRAAPKAPWLRVKPGVTESGFDPATAFETDAAGNAAGGVRSLDVDVPRVRWIGAKRGGFSCMFYGYRLPLPEAELVRRYPDPEAYRRGLRRRADELAEMRWLTPEDRREALR
jgi:hypothetical protein